MDISHLSGTDLALSSTGGLSTVSGPEEGQQRVLRRLMTNAASYFWHLEYGAGLPAYLGKPAYRSRIEGVIRRQMNLEKAVSQTPVPIVNVTMDVTGVVTANIRYVDAITDLTSLLVVPIIG